jgi:hypothetical protein
MTVYEIIALVLSIALGLGFIGGFISDTNNPNSWETLYAKYIEGRNATLEIKLKMLEERTKMMEEETKQMALTMGESLRE